MSGLQAISILKAATSQPASKFDSLKEFHRISVSPDIYTSPTASIKGTKLFYEEEIIRSNGKAKVVRRLYCRNNDQMFDGVGWILNEDVAECMICATAFGWLVARHHCRACGNCICNYCSPEKVILYELIDLGLQRVCTQCFYGQNNVYIVNDRQAKDLNLDFIVDDLLPKYDNGNGYNKGSSINNGNEVVERPQYNHVNPIYNSNASLICKDSLSPPSSSSKSPEKAKRSSFYQHVEDDTWSVFDEKGDASRNSTHAAAATSTVVNTSMALGSNNYTSTEHSTNTYSTTISVSFNDDAGTLEFPAANSIEKSVSSGVASSETDRFSIGIGSAKINSNILGNVKRKGSNAAKLKSIYIPSNTATGSIISQQDTATSSVDSSSAVVKHESGTQDVKDAIMPVVLDKANSSVEEQITMCSTETIMVHHKDSGLYKDTVVSITLDKVTDQVIEVVNMNVEVTAVNDARPAFNPIVGATVSNNVVDALNAPQLAVTSDSVPSKISIVDPGNAHVTADNADTSANATDIVIDNYNLASSEQAEYSCQSLKINPPPEFVIKSRILRSNASAVSDSVDTEHDTAAGQKIFINLRSSDQILVAIGSSNANGMCFHVCSILNTTDKDRNVSYVVDVVAHVDCISDVNSDDESKNKLCEAIVKEVELKVNRGIGLGTSMCMRIDSNYTLPKIIGNYKCSDGVTGPGPIDVVIPLDIQRGADYDSDNDFEFNSNHAVAATFASSIAERDNNIQYISNEFNSHFNDSANHASLNSPNDTHNELELYSDNKLTDVRSSSNDKLSSKVLSYFDRSFSNSIGGSVSSSRSSGNQLQSVSYKSLPREKIIPWEPLLRGCGFILATGVIMKRNQLGLSLTRQLILTSSPSLMYIDARSMTVKGTILWRLGDIPLAKILTSTSFQIKVQERTYVFYTQTQWEPRSWTYEINAAASFYNPDNEGDGRSGNNSLDAYSELKK